MTLSIDSGIQHIPYYPKAALYGADAGWVRLSSNENPYPPSPAVMSALLNALFDLNRYPESEFELKSLISQKYGLEPDSVLIGNGSNEIIESALKAMRLDGRNEVLVPEPSFAFYSIAAHIYGYEAISIPFTSLRLDLELVTRHINDRTRVIFLNNPCNPTGMIFEDKPFKSFLATLPANILVVVDEAYAEFSDSKQFPKAIPLVNEYPVLVMRTFSKAYGLAGLRVGYGIGESALISFLERTKQPFSVNMMALLAAKAALGDERHLKKVLDNNRKGKRFLYESLKALGLKFYPSEANFVMIEMGPRAETVTKRLFEKKILIRWLGGYGLNDYIRVTIGTMEENRVIVEALKRVIA